MLSIINDMFDKVYVVNLKRHTDRKAYVKKHLAGLNFDFDFFEAVDGNKLSEKEIASVYDKAGTEKDLSSKGRLSTSEIGCAMSHIQIYKKALKEDYEHILILEDDVAVQKEYIQNIVEGLRELPPDWDMIYFGIRDYKYGKFMKLKALSYYPLRHLLDPNFQSYSVRELLRFKPRTFSTQLEKAGFHYGSHAYGISKKAYSEILENHMPLTTVIDCILPKLCISGKFKAFKFKRNVFDYNDAFISSIQYVDNQ